MLKLSAGNGKSCVHELVVAWSQFIFFKGNTRREKKKVKLTRFYSIVAVRWARKRLSG